MRGRCSIPQLFIPLILLLSFLVYTRNKLGFITRQSPIFDDLDDKLHSIATASRRNGKIPKILHQTWKNNKLPTKYEVYRNTWLAYHPHWHHHLWTDEENRALVAKHYPWFLETFDSFPVGIMRADSIRYILMHRYGGMYSDLDIEPLRNLDFMFENSTKAIILGYMSCRANEHKVPPSWIMSAQNHAFWLHTLINVQDEFKVKPKWAAPENITGPVLLYHSIDSYVRAKAKTYKWPGKNALGNFNNCTDPPGDIHILPPGLIYPYDWNDREDTPIGSLCSGLSTRQNETACKLKFPNAYTVQYSARSWGDEWETYKRRVS